eukprot:Amastigsp_a841220_227.p7 type:complete len:110 gc:universal Amastigsp_a841220_227:2577-2248(-)
MVVPSRAATSKNATTDETLTGPPFETPNTNVVVESGKKNASVAAMVTARSAASPMATEAKAVLSVSNESGEDEFANTEKTEVTTALAAKRAVIWIEPPAAIAVTLGTAS